MRSATQHCAIKRLVNWKNASMNERGEGMGHETMKAFFLLYSCLSLSTLRFLDGMNTHKLPDCVQEFVRKDGCNILRKIWEHGKWSWRGRRGGRGRVWSCGTEWRYNLWIVFDKNVLDGLSLMWRMRSLDCMLRYGRRECSVFKLTWLTVTIHRALHASSV